MKVIENMDGKGRKGTVVVLLIAAVLVWGAVGYYIVRQFIPRKQVDVPTAVPRQADERPAAMVDTLSLDYPDPFLRPLRMGSAAKAETPVLQKTASPSRVAEPSLPDIVFKGVIGNGQKVEAMVMQNGKMLMLHRGDSLGRFVVVSCSPEALELGSRGKTVRIEAR